jgi:quinol monooxygenase YgiN
LTPRCVGGRPTLLNQPRLSQWRNSHEEIGLLVCCRRRTAARRCRAAAIAGPRRGAQTGGAYINAVDLDINPADTAKFLEFVKENGAASVKEPGCREFNISVLAKDPNHVFLYEVYDNEAALNAHRATDHFKKFAAATANMVTGRNVRPLSPVAFNSKGH